MLAYRVPGSASFDYEASDDLDVLTPLVRIASDGINNAIAWHLTVICREESISTSLYSFIHLDH